MTTRISKRRLLQETFLIAGCALLSLSVAKADYPATVINDGPLAYYRLNDTKPLGIAINSGSLGTAGNGIYFGTVTHRVAGAIIAGPNPAASYDGTGARTAVPYNSSLNPSASNPFTIEAWVMPSIEGLGNAQAPIFNRHSAGNRQGWVFFQRTSDVGWNFRMYNQNGSSQSIDITGGPYTVGAWTHLVAVWNGTTATLYVNGVVVGSQSGGYVANSDAPLTIGAYGADNPGDNPFTGSVDEVAFYSGALSAAQVLAHYQNGINPSPSTPYSSLVASSNPLLYLHLDDADPNIDTAINSGSIGIAGDGIHFPGMKHQVPGAIVGTTDKAAFYTAIDASSQDGGVPTIVPFNSNINPSGSFTVEYWANPAVDGNAGNAQSPMFNRDPSDDNAPNRAGWDMFQRSSSTGWNFRMFNGNAHDKLFDITGGPYTVGAWNHIVAVYNASVPSATLYVNGVQAAQSTTPNGAYNPNTYAPLSIGGYSDGVQNPFIGGIDEVAIYTNVLTAAQVLAHYQNGTNAARSTPYDQLIASANPVEYLRLSEPAKNIAANLGSLGSTANAVFVNSTNGPAGLQSPTFAGLEADNASGDFNGINSYVELLNPTNLNFSGQVTLEAWVQPAASQNGEAYIIAHGGNDNYSAEDALRIENGTYQVLSYDGAKHGADYPVPPEDLGTGNWVHLVGTYDGTNWNLYHNGVQVATAADSTGLLPVANANWAIGARGRWKNGSGFPASGEDRQFSGEIDEVAIYNHALTPQQIQAHYSAGAYGAHPLIVTRSGSQTILTWSTGTLQEATTVTGPYTDVTGVTSPYTAPGGPAMKFYRLRF